MPGKRKKKSRNLWLHYFFISSAVGQAAFRGIMLAGKKTTREGEIAEGGVLAQRQMIL